MLTYHGYGGLDGIVWYGMVKGYGKVGRNKTRWYGVVTYHVLTYHGLDGIVWYGMVKGYGRVEGTKQASSCNNSPPTPCHDYHTYHLLFCDD